MQFREKRPWTTRELVDEAAVVRSAIGERASLVVNDRVDVAAAIGADAVHLGRNDLSPAVARRLLGSDVLIGATANDLQEARRIGCSGIDYLGAGPVFGTASKANPAPALGLDGLRAIVEAVDVPVIAIGSIDAERVREVIATGVHGIAVLSAVVAANDPASAARRIREALDSTRAQAR